jgi:hypothetical protein
LQRDDGSFQSLVEAVGQGSPFDWVLASHVVEHVPDLVGWLAQLAEILVDDGTVILLVPDRRFCFDARRTASTVGQALEAYDEGDLTPSVRAVFDHFRTAVHVQTDRLWLGEIPGPDRRIHTFEEAVGNLERARSGEYIDSHVWTFTPGELVDVLDDLGRLGVLDFAIRDIFATPRNELEFTILLTRIPRGTDPIAAAELREQGRRRAEAAIPAETVPYPQQVMLDEHARTLDELSNARAELQRSQADVVRLQRQVRRMRRRLRAAGRRCSILEARLSAMTASVQWRVGGVITRPLTRLRRAARR